MKTFKKEVELLEFSNELLVFLWGFQFQQPAAEIRFRSAFSNHTPAAAAEQHRKSGSHP